MNEQTDDVETRFLQRLWREIITPSLEVRFPLNPPFEGPPSRMLAAGVSIDDMKRFASYVAYACVFDVVTILDEGVSDIDQPASGWTLMERGADDRLTGHVLSGLHESLLTSDPTGAEGAEVFAGFDTPEDRGH